MTIFIDDFGYVIEVESGIDLSSQTALSLLMKKGATEVTLTGGAVKVGDNSVAQFTLGVNDITEAGIYTCQLKYQDASRTLHGQSFTVSFAEDLI